MADVAITTTIVDRGKLIGGIRCVLADLTIGSGTTYNSTTKIGTAAGVNANGFQLRTLENLVFLDAAWGGYAPWWDRTNKSISLFRTAPAGSVAAPTFTGTAPLGDLNLATPAFSGTGLTAALQVMTTTSTHTMTLNECAGMWLIPATGATPPMLILSNTAVTAAAAVLTVQGAAATDAGAYKIVKALAPVGTNSAPAFTGTAAALAEVANAVNISTAISTRALRVMALGV